MDIHEALKTLEFEIELGDDAVVTDALVLMRVSRVEGPSTFLWTVSAGTDDVVTQGLLSAADNVMAAQWRNAKDLDD